MIDSDKFIKLLSEEIINISPEENERILALTSSNGIDESYISFLEEYLCLKAYMTYSALLYSDFYDNNDNIHNEYQLLNKLVSQTNILIKESTALFPTHLFSDKISKKLLSRVENYLQECSASFNIDTITAAFIETLPIHMQLNIDVPLLSKLTNQADKLIIKNIDRIIRFKSAVKNRSFLSEIFPNINIYLEFFIAFALFLLIPIMLTLLIDNEGQRMAYGYAYIIWAIPALLTYLEIADPSIQFRHSFFENVMRVWLVLFALLCVKIIVS